MPGGTLGATHVSGRFPDPVRAQPRCSLLLGSSLLSRLASASPQPLPGFLFAWRGSPSPGGTEASPRPLPTAVVVKTQPQGPVQPGAAAGCDSRSSSRPRGASVCSFQARWTPKAACPPRGRSVQLWPHHVVGAGGLLMRWPGGCLGAAMALCMPSRPPERAGFGVPGLAVPPAADPRRLRLF